MPESIVTVTANKTDQNRRSLGPLVLLALAVFLYALVFSILTINRYAAFEARSQDMGNLNQVIWNLAHGNGFRFTNYEGITSRLSLHVEPILLLIAPIYRLFPNVETLLIIQATVVALGAIPLFALARHKLISNWAALGFALAFLLNPAVQGANWYEFHPVTLAPTLLMAAFYFLVSGRTGWFALFAVLAAGCKEEIGLLIFMLGLYTLIALRRPSLGLTTMILGLGWSLFAVLGIQHSLAAGNIHWNRYAYLGDSPAAIVQALLTQPELIWQQLQAANVVRYLTLLMLPVAFTPLLGLDVFLLALPSLAINLLADFSPMHEVNTLIYAAPIVPFVMLGGVYGAARLQRWLTRAWTGEETMLAPHFERIAGTVLGGFVLAAALLSQGLYGYLPGGGNYLPLEVTPHHQQADVIIGQIPPEAAVSAQDRLNPHVSGRETVYIFPRVEDADMVLVDVTGSAWPQHPSDLRASVDELLAGDFGVAAAEDGYLLLSRDASSKSLPASFFSAWQTPEKDAPKPAEALADFGDQLRLLDVDVQTDRYGELITSLKWQPLQTLNEDWRFYIAYLAPDGTLLHASEFYPPAAALWYPTSTWRTDAAVQISTLPWTINQPQMMVGVGVYNGENWQTGQRLMVDPATTTLPRFEGDTLLRVDGYAQDPLGLWAPISPQHDAPQRALDARLGEHISLTGADVPTINLGNALDFALHWQSDGAVDFDYTAFAHLLDAAGDKVTQLDWQPRDAVGLLPTSQWPLGQPVVDRQHLPLPEDLPAGNYQLIVGLYDWRDGVRLPVEGADTVPGDAVLAGSVRLPEPNIDK